MIYDLCLKFEAYQDAQRKGKLDMSYIPRSSEGGYARDDDVR